MEGKTMSEKENKTTGEEVVTENVSTPEKEGAAKNEDKKPMKKKENLFKRGWNRVKANKPAIIAGAVGVVTGVAGTIAVSEIGKRTAERRERRNVTPQENEISPLDPNY